MGSILVSILGPNMGFKIEFNMGLNIGFNFGVQYWIQFLVQYWVSILGSILGTYISKKEDNTSGKRDTRWPPAMQHCMKNQKRPPVGSKIAYRVRKMVWWKASKKVKPGFLVLKLGNGGYEGVHGPNTFIRYFLIA